MFEKFLIKHGTHIFLAYMLIALVPIIMFQIELDKPFILGFKYLSLPVTLIVFSIYWFALPNWKKENNLFLGLLMSGLISLLIVLMSGSYLMGINAWIGKQRPYEISGKIIELEARDGSKYNSYFVTLENKDGSIKKLDVSENLYSNLTVGDNYTDVWKLGSLGLIYK